MPFENMGEYNGDISVADISGQLKLGKDSKETYGKKRDCADSL